MRSAVALIALVLGYKSYVDACREKEGIKLLGQVIGIFVMIAAVLSLVCGAVKCFSRGADCPFSKKNGSMMSKANCPMASQNPDQPGQP